MPFKSEAQRRKFYAMESRGEISSGEVEAWEKKTGGKQLSEKVSHTVLAKEYGSLAAVKTTGILKAANMGRYHPLMGPGLGAASGYLAGSDSPGLSAMGGAVGGSIGLPVGSVFGHMLGTLLAVLLKRPMLSKRLASQGARFGAVVGSLAGGQYGGQLMQAADRTVRGVGRAAVSPLELLAARAREKAETVFGPPY